MKDRNFKVKDISNESDFIRGLRNNVGVDNIVEYVNEREIKKPELLEFPVIGKTFSNEYMTQEIGRISHLIAEYNGAYRVRRIFVNPDHLNVVIDYKSSVIGSNPRSEIEEAKAKAAKFTGKDSLKKTGEGNE